MNNRKRYLIFLLTGFLSGLLLGTILITVYIGHELDKSYQQINQLQTAVTEKDARLEKVEEASKQKRFIIKKIDVELQLEGDEIERSSLMKHIKERYYIILGKEVKDIDPDLLTGIIDNRIMRLDSRSFRLAVQKIVLSDVLKIWVTATLLKD